MAQDKKAEELEYLNYFLASDEGKNWHKENKIKSHIESEAALGKHVRKRAGPFPTNTMEALPALSLRK